MVHIVTEVDPDQQTQQQQPAEVETPEPTDEMIEDARAKSKDLEDLYKPGSRESVVLPGTDGTISGTAIQDWVDDEGNIKPPEDR